MPAAAPLGHDDRSVTDQTRQPRSGPLRPLVGLRAPTPQPELRTVVGAHLGGFDRHVDDAGGDALVTVVFGGGRPAVELPSHPLDHGSHGEPRRQRPQPFAALTVIGLDHHDELGADPPLPGQHLHQ